MQIHRYTTKSGNVYAITLTWPTSGTLILDAPIPTPNLTRVTMMGLENRLFDWKFEPAGKGGSDEESLDETETEDAIKPSKPYFSISVPPIAISELPSLWAWVFKLTHVN